MSKVVDLPPHPFPPGATKSPPKKRFPFTWVLDAELKLDEHPVVDELIERGAFCLVYGPPGSGKSFFTADIAQHVATAKPWRGRKTTQGLVVYVASEAGASLLRRFIGWRDNRLAIDTSAPVPLAVITRGPNLLAELDLVALGDQLEEMSKECGLPISLVIFDTLSRSIPGGDENRAEDMTMVIHAADYLRDRFGTATTYVHHSGKDPGKGARGHSSLFAAADVVLRIEDKCATLEKVRDGVAGERFPFELEPVQVGTRPDGKPVMTCLLNATSAPAPTSGRSAPTRGRGALGLSTLREAIDSGGESLPGTSTIPQGVRAVTLQAWRERFDLRYGKDEKTPSRNAFYKARESLLDSGHIGISDPYVWIT